MSTIRSRREPPPWRRATVVDVTERSERLTRLTLTGPELEGLDIGLPASSVRLLVPDPGGASLEIPTWTGNEFLRADGGRPPIRTLTPVELDPHEHTLVVEVVLHGEGPLSTWAASGPLGDPVALSGTGRGYSVEHHRDVVLAGDESAIPAIATILRALPPDAVVTVFIESIEPVATVELPPHRGATVRWLERAADERPGAALATAIAGCPIGDDTRIWVAGEAAGIHRIRQHLFDERAIPRRRATVRGYWKAGRDGD